MTHLLKQAFSKVSKLPDVEQNVIARWMMEELISDHRWTRAFAESEDLLSKLAREAMDEHRRGKTKVLDPERL